MADNDTQRDPLEALAAEFTERCRRGEQPSVEAYAAQHPDLADDIRDLFSTIREVERAKGAMSASGPARAVMGPMIERLGDFRIIRELGHGGMGIVYEAEQESLGRRVAIKVLPHLYLRSASRRERFEREARTAARLHHTNIVPVFGVGEQDGYPYFVMQYIRGVSLDMVFERLHAVHTQLARTPQAGSHSAAAFDFAAVAKSLLASDPGARSHHADAESTEKVQMTNCDSTPGQLTAARAATGCRISDDQRQSETGNRQPSPSSPCLRGDDPQRPLTAAYWRRLAALMAQAADALAYAHAQGVLHRDVKPSNLLLDADGTLWVTDFGLAKAMQDSGPELTQAGDVVGTLRYMSPEQYARRGEQRSDVYGLGVTLYELATLQPAFTDLDRSSLTRAVLDPQGLWPARRLCPAMPRDLETILEKATAREAAHRYASAAALRDDLLRFADDQPIAARPVSLAERMWRWSRRNPALAATSGAAIALLVAVAVVASTAYLSVRSANIRARSALDGEMQQRRRAQDTADLAVETLETLFNEFAPESPVVSGEFKLDDSETGSVSVTVPPVLSDDTARMLERMLAVYARLARQEGGSRELKLKVAAAQRRVGEIQERLGQYEEARQAYGESIRQYEALFDARRPDDEALLTLARLHQQMGKVLLSLDQLQEADTEFQKSQALLSRVPEPARNSPPVRFELARVQYLMALPPGGALGLQPEMVRPGGPGRPPGRGPGPDDGPPGQPFNRADEQRALPPPGPGRAGRPPADRPRGPLPPAEGEMAGPGPSVREDTPRGPLSREGPGRRPFAGDGYRYRPFLPLSDGSRPDDPPDLPQGPGPGADRPEPFMDGPPPHEGPPPEEPSGAGREMLIRQQEHLAQAIDILNDLTAEWPQVPAYRHLLAQCLRLRRPAPGSAGPGRMAQRQGDLDRAIDLLETLAAEFPDEPQYTLDLCQACAVRPPARPEPFTQSHVPPSLRGEGPPRLQENGDADRLEAAVQRMEKLTRERPGIPSYTFALAQLYERWSRQDRVDGFPRRALENLRRAIELHAGLIEKFPRVTAYAAAMAVCERDLSQMLLHMGQLEQAETNASSAVRRLKPLASGDSIRPFVGHLLGACYEQLAQCLRARGKEGEARDAQRDAVRFRHAGAVTTRTAVGGMAPE